MDKQRSVVMQKFSSPLAAKAAERAYYASLSPMERMEIFCELMEQMRDYEREAAAGFPRVGRIVRYPRG